jgi:DNA replication and repair protein RecF
VAKQVTGIISLLSCPCAFDFPWAKWPSKQQWPSNSSVFQNSNGLRISMASIGRTLLKRLVVQRFRNLNQVVFDPSAGLNIVSGENGHGKTSLIEALYILATSQSFRSHRLGEVIQEGQEQALIQGQVDSFGLVRSLRAAISPRGRSFQIDGKRPKKRLDYALSTPVIAFVPADMSLCSGAATGRRRLLDRIIVYLDPLGAEARSTYLLATRERQRLLSERGPRARELDAFEQVMARAGARWAVARDRVIAAGLCRDGRS